MNNLAELINAANELYKTEKTNEAISLFRYALNLDPLNREVHIKLAYALCRYGNYSDGADEFLWIWMQQFGNQKDVLKDYENLKDKIILLSCDAGLGDSIMFARYSKLLKNKVKKVILQVQKPLVRLFVNSEIADDVIGESAKYIEHDIRLPFHNLMSATGYNPASQEWDSNEYLFSKKEEAEMLYSLIPRKGNRKVGICWRGNPNLPDDNNRSISLEEIKRFTKPDDVLISLIPEDGMGIKNDVWRFSFKDIAETAALILNLDYIITVDTMICHLCGALGKPTLLLNRYNGCWRWGEGYENSKWYSSVKIYRQNKDFSWGD